MSLVGNWNYPTTVKFGPGRIRELPDHCRALGMSRPLLITDPGIRNLPIVTDTVALCEEAGMRVGVFSEVKPNPVGKNVDDGVVAYKAGGHDGVIAFGGGSALDVAKAVAMMVGQDRPLWDFEDREDWYTRVKLEGFAQIVAVPTTSGTGSEVGRCSVITDEETHTKKLIFHPRLQPARVICDPALTLSLPRFFTAATGIDALSHNLEAYCAPGFHPQADGIALMGMRLIHRSLIRAVDHGDDLDARSEMMAASLMGAAAFQKGLGAMHALAHPIGAVLDAQHGLTNGVVMPYVLAFNRPAITERLELLARALDLPGHSFTSVMDWVLNLRQACGIPHTADALGVNGENMHLLARMAVDDPSAGTNPLPLDLGATTSLLQAAVAGHL